MHRRRVDVVRADARALSFDSGFPHAIVRANPRQGLQLGGRVSCATAVLSLRAPGESGDAADQQ